MKILALDLGTATGITTNIGFEPEKSWSVKLATPKEVTEWKRDRRERRHDPRICRFVNLLAPYLPEADTVVFEDVEFARYRMQVQLWSSFRGALWTSICEYASPDTYVQAVPVGTLKKWSAGRGGVDKDYMAAAFLWRTRGMKRFEDQKKTIFDYKYNLTLDNNAIDSYLLFLWAKEHLNRK